MIKRKDWTEEETDRKAEAAKKAGMRRTRWTPATGAWRSEEEALLGTDHDPVIAASIGRTVHAVTSHRTRLGIQAFSGNPTNGRPWTPEELAKLGTSRDEDLAAELGRTARAVKL